MNPPASQFTALQIGRACGKSRQSILRALDGVNSGPVMVGGNLAQAWTVADLPAVLLAELEPIAIARGCRSVEHLLAAPGEHWQPAVPLSQVAQRGLDKAAKLRRGLARALSLQNDLSVSSAEAEAFGLADYQKEFGHTITARHLRQLIRRTIERDGGANAFDRLELYLDEAPARKPEFRPRISLATQSEFRELSDVISGFKNPLQPSAEEREYLWLRTFELYDEKTGAGAPGKKTRLALRAFLIRNAPFLAENAEALRVSFKRKHDRWLQNERNAAALIDGRREASGNHRAPELTQEDRDALIAHATLKCGGRVSQAWRELVERRALSEPLLSHYLANPASKSYCPARIRNAVQHEVELLDDIHHGPRTAKLNGAHLSRDWSNVAPMDWISADDLTAEVYFCTPDGQGGETLTRGQILLASDVRTNRILGYALLPEKSYNARAIRTLFTKISDEHGLPRRGYYLEGGIWESSRLINGDRNEVPFSWVEAELGLRSLGLEFRRSRLPRSKPVERVIGAIQDLMDGEPGFVGGNEMKEKFERVQKQKLLVQSGKEPASKFFYSCDQWADRLDELSAQYNASRQDGKMTGGLSPDEAFEKLERRDDPPLKLSAGCRYLLSHHKRPIKVTSNGITLRFGKQAYIYRNEQTGRLIGQTVLAFWNPEAPEILTVTDMNRENPFCVQRAQDVPAMDAPPELLEQEMRRIEAHNSFAKTRYRILKAKYSVPFRRSMPDADTVSLGVEIATQQNALSDRHAKLEKQQGKARKAARHLNMALSPTAARRPETAPALERLSELLKEGDE